MARTNATDLEVLRLEEDGTAGPVPLFARHLPEGFHDVGLAAADDLVVVGWMEDQQMHLVGLEGAHGLEVEQTYDFEPWGLAFAVRDLRSEHAFVPSMSLTLAGGDATAFATSTYPTVELGTRLGLHLHELPCRR